MGGRTARSVYNFFPDVKVRMKRRSLSLSHHAVQLVTGHGKLKGKLFELCLVAEPWCACGMVEQNSRHILWECPILEDVRDEMLAGLSVDTPRPAWCAELVLNNRNVACFEKFVEVWVSRWESLSGDGLAPSTGEAVLA